MYIATKGGEAAIQQAELLYHQLNGTVTLELVQQIQATMPYLLDRVMGEASLYAPELAALAIAQTGGDLYEAVLVLRAFRSTQPRLAYAKPITPDSMLTIRRISAAFKDIPGGQVLGPSLDYSHRILRLDILDGASTASESAETEAELPETPAEPTYPLLAEWQRQNGLLAALPEQKPIDAADIPDVTRDPIMVPAPRAHRLQALARADTGGVLALGYSSMRGYGLIHPTVNELRLAHAEVMVKHPVTGAEFSAGRVRVSQAEVVSKDSAGFQIGFAATLGWNEVKLIAASTLDMEMNNANSHPALSEDFVLYHTEPVESSGFCIHFKLPHYVTFASSMDAVRAVQALYSGAKSTEVEAAETAQEFMSLKDLTAQQSGYSYAYLDAFAKRELRRRMLKAIAIPGCQIPYASRELPIARGWGTGGLQVTLSLVGPESIVKVIDQGADDSVNAANLRRFVTRMSGAETTTDTLKATLIQSRHRIPEERLREGQALILQVPDPEPLRLVEANMAKTREMHADSDYGQMWLTLYEQLVRYKQYVQGASYPVLVHKRYVMSPSPIPRWDNPALHQAQHLTLLSAGREKRLYAVPPYTNVYPLEFDDVPFQVEDQSGRMDIRTGAKNKFMNELPQADGSSLFELSDTGYADKLTAGEPTGATYYDDQGNFYHDGYLKPRADLT